MLNNVPFLQKKGINIKYAKLIIITINDINKYLHVSKLLSLILYLHVKIIKHSNETMIIKQNKMSRIRLQILQLLVAKV
jgi:hypothetical protein